MHIHTSIAASVVHIMALSLGRLFGERRLRDSWEGYRAKHGHGVGFI